MALLNDEEIKKGLKDLNDWKQSGKEIGKEFKLKDFRAALSFVNDIGKEAEEMNHHPDILIHSYNKVRVTISTHSEGGITPKDFKLAQKIESAQNA
jgi:4a-hydroxytetrahydrobiopterin dehydratase